MNEVGVELLGQLKKTHFLKWILSPPMTQIRASRSHGFCPLGNEERRAWAGHWKKSTGFETIFSESLEVTVD